MYFEQVVPFEPRLYRTSSEPNLLLLSNLQVSRTSDDPTSSELQTQEYQSKAQKWTIFSQIHHFFVSVSLEILIFHSFGASQVSLNEPFPNFRTLVIEPRANRTYRKKLLSERTSRFDSKFKRHYYASAARELFAHESIALKNGAIFSSGK